MERTIRKDSVLGFLRKYGTVVTALIIFIVFSFIIDNFFNSTSILMLLRQMSVLTILALGFTFVMAGGGFDMSIGTTIGLVSMIFGYILIDTNNLFLAIMGAVAVGLAVGTVNGLFVAYIGVPDFIGTFAVGSVVYGVKMLISGGHPVFFPADVTPGAQFIGRGFVGEIPFPIVLMVIFTIITVFVLGKTSLGRRIYAVGGNRTASMFAGINVRKYRLISFIICGLGVAATGVLLSSRLNSSQPLAGEDMLLEAIAVVFLSTTMFGEGEPTPLGTVVGAFTITTLGFGMTMLGMGYHSQNITKGVVVIFAVLMSVALRRKDR